ncbi:diguanylate cyclase domain-containing protein [Thiohalorhabdus sp.]|uniref:diguanylate cyclase domain-containing protein n=1 Tax=Thiohalorhabdus sp. TaxID=3094134 RepID=UPI002FC335F0
MSRVSGELARFKHFNDTCGHETGDTILRQLGGLLGASLRREDSAFRYGGEELTVTIPEADEAGLRRGGRELIRSRVAEEVAPAVDADLAEPVTVSIGGALFPDTGRDPHSLLAAADEALYQAKLESRNRMVCAADGERSTSSS